MFKHTYITPNRKKLQRDNFCRHHFFLHPQPAAARQRGKPVAIDGHDIGTSGEITRPFMEYPVVDRSFDKSDKTRQAAKE